MPNQPPAGLSASQYWHPKHAQKLYVAFCLMMSSIQDALPGLCEAETQNHKLVRPPALTTHSFMLADWFPCSDWQLSDKACRAE